MLFCKVEIDAVFAVLNAAAACKHTVDLIFGDEIIGVRVDNRRVGLKVYGFTVKSGKPFHEPADFVVMVA